MAEDIHRKALALIEQGDWDAAHRLVQSHGDRLSCLIHAWLHREEGDHGNAAYWYARADEAFPDNSREEELERLRGLIG